MQSTTTINTNRQKAEELIAVRDDMKRLAAKEKALKKHFASLMTLRETDDLLVQSAILISRHHRSRETYDTTLLNHWFDETGIDAQRFKKITHFEVISAKAV